MGLAAQDQGNEQSNRPQASLEIQRKDLNRQLTQRKNKAIATSPRQIPKVKIPTHPANHQQAQ